MLKFLSGVFLATAVAGCTLQPTAPTSPKPQNPIPSDLTGRQMARNFVQVVESVEPVAEQECRRRTTGVDCDFQIAIDDNPQQPPNAFQTLDDNNRPLIVFTISLIATARNVDELAFVMGHEAAHHIQGHIPRQTQNATAGALVLGGLAGIFGAGDAAIQSAQQIGASVGARTFSKDFELEADQLGTIIAARAGYDPVRGAQFFNRIPDPVDRFLGTHPPNAARQEIVRRTAAGL